MRLVHRLATMSVLNIDSGGTFTNDASAYDNNPTRTNNPSMDTVQNWESVFGPAARDIKQDPLRNKRHSRLHLPDALRGSNPYLADRIDGLITSTTASPFTTLILPYQYLEQVDQKIKWNAFTFDEALASR